jgi:hypothetical protein
VIEVLVEVSDTRLRAAIRAESIRRAVDVTGSYYPDTDVRVVYPIDPEAFFVRDSAALAARLVGFKMPEKLAG